MARRSLVPVSVRRAIRRNSLRRGLLGGEPLWRAVFVVRQLARWSSKAAKRDEMPVRFSQRLRPGDGIAITHLDPRAEAAARRS